jgi:cyclomaltodextrinase / maltogenic alpha-amylase / neopullulanase
VARFIVEAFSYWVREFGIDGFRVDAVWGIKERNPEWLTTFLAEMNRIKPDSLLIAEASARDEFYFEQGFDAAYDWTDELGHWAWSDALGGITPIGEAIVDVLTDGGQGYHENALVMRFLNNNDTGERFVSTYGVDFYRIAPGDAAQPAGAALPLLGRRGRSRISAVLPDRTDRLEGPQRAA